MGAESTVDLGSTGADNSTDCVEVYQMSRIVKYKKLSNIIVSEDNYLTEDQMQTMMVLHVRTIYRN